MKKYMALIALTALSISFFATSSLAQRGMMWRGGGGWCTAGTPYDSIYNPQTIETISGEVMAVDKFRPQKGMSYGVHLIVKTDKETISVHLGPAWYIRNQSIKIAPKDKIEVKGSRVTFEGKPAIIASEVKKGDDVLTLRDTNGFPVWNGWRRK
ncbi:MAG: DNA-binding protein [Dissulfurimicrobium sp.]|uniref:DNA-binding protein n=1 Tax=Dissulfurimicrobium sp. TaxID=2022436 RepID=UPI004049B44B